MDEITTILAFVMYILIAFVTSISIYIYHISNIYRPNFMITATKWLLVGILSSSMASILMRVLSYLHLNVTKFGQDMIFIPARLVLLISLINFLKNTVQLKDE